MEDLRYLKYNFGKSVDYIENDCLRAIYLHNLDIDKKSFLKENACDIASIEGKLPMLYEVNVKFEGSFEPSEATASILKQSSKILNDAVRIFKTKGVVKKVQFGGNSLLIYGDRDFNLPEKVEKFVKKIVSEKVKYEFDGTFLFIHLGNYVHQEQIPKSRKRLRSFLEKEHPYDLEKFLHNLCFNRSNIWAVILELNL